MGRPIRPRPMNPTCFTVESPSLRGSVILSYIGETMTRLKNKAAFITGAGGGIGRAIADAMEREGAKVARVDIDGKTPYPMRRVRPPRGLPGDGALRRRGGRAR